MNNEINTKDIDLLISRILSKEASLDEILSFNHWLNQEEQNEKYFLVIKEYFNVRVVSDEVMAEIAFEKYKKRLDFSQSKSKNLHFFRLFSIAASITLLILSGIAAYYYTVRKNPVEYYTHVCHNGIHQMTLDDSTIVYLNENSRLTYSNEFGKKNRHVRLEGEAYFDVSHSNTLFTVNLGDARIEVMGTKFNVRSFSDSSQIITTLEEGAICFKNNNQTITLHPNDQLVYNKKDLSFNVFTVETAYATTWKNKVYKYASISLTELCKELEKIYAVTIKINPEYRDIIISGSFEYKMDINQVLDMIRKSLPFHYQVKGNTIIIN